MGPQASVLASLVCLICKMGVMNVTSQGFCEDEMNFIYNIWCVCDGTCYILSVLGLFATVYSFPSVANMFIHVYTTRASQVTLVVKNPPANAGESSPIPGSGRSPGGGRNYPPSVVILGFILWEFWWLLKVHEKGEEVHDGEFRLCFVFSNQLFEV